MSNYCWAWNDWNAIAVETFDILPFLGPVASDAPRSFFIMGNNYGTTSKFPPGTFVYTIDPDLHNNLPGTIVATVTAKDSNPDSGTGMTVSLPGFNPTGTHKQMFRFNRPDGTGNRELDALLVWNQVVGTSTPPPPPPPPDRCAGLVGQSGVFSVAGIPFLATITSTTCTFSAVVQ
jgi:hypothetical protein